MSAKNWTTCHRCRLLNNEEIANAKDELSKSYGNISQEEYDKRKERIERGFLWPEDEDEDEDSIPYSDGETRREDYEFEFSDGHFRLMYRTNCDRCGFEFKTDYSEKIV